MTLIAPMTAMLIAWAAAAQEVSLCVVYNTLSGVMAPIGIHRCSQWEAVATVSDCDYLGIR
jgi:multisubunit Na+/H+ antiporter MnhG subunit